MRILFSGQSVVGHVFPLLPLERAARTAGHETAVMSGPDLASSLPAEVRLLAVGPGFQEILSETIRRPWGGDPSQAGGPGSIELFTGASVDLTFVEAQSASRAFAPDVIVCEPTDFTGRLVADTLGVPWAVHGIAGPLPPGLVETWEVRAARQFDMRSLTATSPVAVIDLYPAVLSEHTPTAGAVRLPLRPTAHADIGAPTSSRIPTLGRGRGVALLTIGTTIFSELDGDLLPGMVAATLAADLDVVVTAEKEALVGLSGDDRLHPVGFLPLADLLPLADVVVTVGGSGTVLAALASGLPMVIMPVKADHPDNAARVAAAGAGLAVDHPEDITGALHRVLQDRSFRDGAERAAHSIAAMPGPAEVLDQLVALVAAAPRDRRRVPTGTSVRRASRRW